MTSLRGFPERLRGLFRRGAEDPEFDDEVREHLRLLTERNLARGMNSEEAGWAARRQFGNVALLAQDRREARTIPILENLWRNARHGVRQLGASPLFTAVAILTLALGIGANTAVFTLLDQLVLRALPVQNPEALVMIWTTGPHIGNNSGVRTSSYPMYQDIQRGAEAFESVFCRFQTSAAVRIGDTTERADVELVSGNYFQALGAGPALGRVFSPESDDRVYRGHPSVVLSHRYWLERFAGDPGVVGRKILVNNYPMEIAGVSAPDFHGVSPVDSAAMRVPVQMKPAITPGWDDLGERRSQWVQVFGRLKRGHTVASARASLQPLLHRILRQEAGEWPLNKLSSRDRDTFLRRAALVEGAATGYSVLRERYSAALVVLMCMAGLILLITCSNVANLLIARASTRRKEIAVRLAMGAGRGALIAQLLVESLMLSLAGAALGLGFAVAGTHGLLALLPGQSAARVLRAEPDLRILLFSIAVALAAGLAFGLVPAVQATQLDLSATLKDAAGSVGGGRTGRLRKALVAAQAALSFLLLAGAALFGRTLFNLNNTRTGFTEPQRLVTFQVDASQCAYALPRMRAFYSNVLAELRATPGVQSAAFARMPLLQGWGWGTSLRVEGRESQDEADPQTFVNFVSPGYWNAMGVPLLEGRDFDARDRIDTLEQSAGPQVAIVNRKFAEHFFGKRNAIGRRIGWAGGPGNTGSLDMKIVGVVEDSLNEGPRSGMHRQVFLPFFQSFDPAAAFFYARISGVDAALFPRLRNLVAKVDPTIPVYGIKTLQQQLDETLSTERLIAVLSSVFGVLAAMLVALGLYGVMAFAVARRTREIGLRLALGATSGRVLWLVLREALILLGAGLVAGVPCAYLLSQFVSSQLFGVARADPCSCAAAITMLVLVGTASALVPARRASRIEPLAALRHE